MGRRGATVHGGGGDFPVDVAKESYPSMWALSTHRAIPGPLAVGAMRNAKLMLVGGSSDVR